MPRPIAAMTMPPGVCPMGISASFQHLLQASDVMRCPFGGSAHLRIFQVGRRGTIGKEFTAAYLRGQPFSLSSFHVLPSRTSAIVCLETPYARANVAGATPRASASRIVATREGVSLALWWSSPCLRASGGYYSARDVDA